MAGNQIDWQKRYKQLENSSKNDCIKHYYRNAIFDGNTAISDVPLVALDFETTGLNFNHDDIVSAGLVPFNTRRISCSGSKHWLVNPKQKLDEESIVIHGITHSEVVDAPDFSKIIEPLLAALAGKVIVVHFAPIERHFLYQALQARLGEGLEFAVIDTLELEKRALQARQGLIGRLFNKKLDSVRLGDSRKRYSLPAYQSHSALTDALATAELLHAQLAYHYRDDTRLADLWI